MGRIAVPWNLSLQNIHLIAAASACSAVQARQEAQGDSGITNAVEASDKLKQLYARIGYLRTITPRQPGDSSCVAAGTYVLRDGQLVPSMARPESRWQEMLLNRQHITGLNMLRTCAIFPATLNAAVVLPQGGRWNDEHGGGASAKRITAETAALWPHTGANGTVLRGACVVLFASGGLSL